MLTANNKTRKIKNAIMTMAAVLAIGGVMAQHLVHNAANLYWYSKSASGSYVYDHQGTDPTENCQGSDQICAKGFSSEQNASLITDATSSQDIRYKDE